MHFRWYLKKCSNQNGFAQRAGKPSGAMAEKEGQCIPAWAGLGSDPRWHWWQIPMSMGAWQVL